MRSAEKLLDVQPDNVQWLRDVAVVQNKIGDLMTVAGRTAEALDAYRNSLSIAERLVAINPQVTEWQRDLAISLVKVGDATVATDRDAARGYYERSRVIRERLAAEDAGSLQAQRDVSTIYDRIGNIHNADERYEDALDFYRKSFAIRQTIARIDKSQSMGPA